MDPVRILDITDDATFRLIPPCADPGFDHRSCDHWEDAERGSKAARAAWFAPADPAGQSHRTAASPSPAAPANPFLADLEAARREAPNPFALTDRTGNPFATPGDDEAGPIANPFAPPPPARPVVGTEAPRKLQLLARGLGVVGSYAKVLLVEDVPAAYAQFGPLSAYPRAQRTRELYPALPVSPLPAVITCIATTAQARRQGLARRLVHDVCDDLARRGFAAVEVYPEPSRDVRLDATSAATPAFWTSVGFAVAVDDERYPVMRRDLD